MIAAGRSGQRVRPLAAATLAAAVLGAAAVAASTAGCRRGVAAPAAASAAPAAAWREQDSYRYQVKLSSKARVALAAAPVGFELTGKLTLRPQPPTGGAAAFVATVEDADIHVDAGSPTKLPADLAEQLAGPWGFELADGRAQSVRVRGGTKPFAIGIVETLAAAFQHPAGPAGPGADAWQDEEADGTGRYQARYQRGAEPGTFTKVKLSYHKTSVPAETQLMTLDWTPVVVASRGELRLRDGDLASVSSFDEVEVAVTAASRVHSTTTLALTLVGRGAAAAAPEAWSRLLASTVAVAIGGTPSPEALGGARRAPAVVANVSFEKALADAERQNQAAPGSASSPMAGPAPDVDTARAQLDSFRHLVAALRGHPENLARAASAVDGGSPAGKAVLDALGSAGDADAQALLVKEMSSRGLPDPLRREAAFALTRTARPTAASVNALVAGLADPLLHRYAVYGLGTFARVSRRSGDVALADQATGTLMAELKRTKTASERVDVLRGIANSGDARALPSVKSLLDDEDESTRAAAVDAIRLMPNPEVDALLAKHLVSSEGAGVRNEALDAAKLRAPSQTLATAVAGVATSPHDTRSRMKAVRIMEQWLPARPELRMVLEQLAHSATNDEVSQAAKAVLGT
jgi:hypothetical protein